jgi:putative Holliday junction resolvase
MAAEGILLGFDFGTRRIGVAVGNRRLSGARSLKTLTSRGEPDWQSIGELIGEWEPEALVVGVPLTMSGAAQPTTDAARKFIEQLEARFKLPVHSAEERMSTMEAQSQLREQRSSGLRRRKLRDEDLDATAARLILEHWLLEHVDRKTAEKA